MKASSFHGRKRYKKPFLSLLSRSKISPHSHLHHHIFPPTSYHPRLPKHKTPNHDLTLSELQGLQPPSQRLTSLPIDTSLSAPKITTDPSAPYSPTRTQATSFCHLQPCALGIIPCLNAAMRVVIFKSRVEIPGVIRVTVQPPSTRELTLSKGFAVIATDAEEEAAITNGETRGPGKQLLRDTSCYLTHCNFEAFMAVRTAT